MTQFQDLYERHAPGLYRFALYLCGNHAQAEDIVAETFVRAWTAPTPVRFATAKAYLCTIARNCYLHDTRRSRRQTSLADEPSETFADPSPGPLALAERRGDVRRLAAALRAVPEADRSALLMHTVQDLSYAEIASALHLTVPAVKARIHRARLKIARTMTSLEQHP